MTSPTLYLAGPMRGRPAFGFPAFDRARDQLRAAGFEVICPAEHDRAVGFDPAGMAGTDAELAAAGFDLRAALAWDLEQLARAADALVLLPGWETSTGARLELAVARTLDLTAYTVDSAGRLELLVDVPDQPGPVGPELLDEARQLIAGARHADYGDAGVDFARAVAIFELRTGHQLTAADGLVFLECVKQSRDAHRPKVDNLVDLAGYVALEADVRARPWAAEPGVDAWRAATTTPDPSDPF